MARAHVGTSMIVQVEIDGLDQLDEALKAGPDIILLDNFSDEDLRKLSVEPMEQRSWRPVVELASAILSGSPKQA